MTVCSPLVLGQGAWCGARAGQATFTPGFMAAGHIPNPWGCSPVFVFIHWGTQPLLSCHNPCPREGPRDKLQRGAEEGTALRVLITSCLCRAPPSNITYRQSGKVLPSSLGVRGHFHVTSRVKVFVISCVLGKAHICVTHTHTHTAHLTKSTPHLCSQPPEPRALSPEPGTSISSHQETSLHGHIHAQVWGFKGTKNVTLPGVAHPWAHGSRPGAAGAVRPAPSPAPPTLPPLPGGAP